ncbi:Uncharacterised protein [Kingella potus]|uniref:CCGSCS motif protein n=1 Tax=Kingella potus TaxID=265175 RepID=A0A377R4Q7_9NEIS|nr:hypothetical protein [Kingella potus]STR03323.1 Uncharacterised protein [Kingella potus]
MSEQENKIKVDTDDSKQPQEESVQPPSDGDKGETTESGCCGVCGG